VLYLGVGTGDFRAHRRRDPCARVWTVPANDRPFCAGGHPQGREDQIILATRDAPLQRRVSIRVARTPSCNRSWKGRIRLFSAAALLAKAGGKFYTDIFSPYLIPFRPRDWNERAPTVG